MSRPDLPPLDARPAHDAGKEYEMFDVTEDCESRSPRAEVLRDAEALITGDRNSQYGEPTQDFTRTAEVLNALGYAHVVDGTVRTLRGSDVARILACLKISRSVWSPDKRDHWVDLAGYAACGWECAEKE